MTLVNRPLLFSEVVVPGEPSHFDVELDRFCQDRLTIGEASPGWCNLCESDTTFMLHSEIGRAHV